MSIHGGLSIKYEAARHKLQWTREFVKKQPQSAGAAAQQNIGQKLLQAFFFILTESPLLYYREQLS